MVNNKLLSNIDIQILIIPKITLVKYFSPASEDVIQVSLEAKWNKGYNEFVVIQLFYIDSKMTINNLILYKWTW